MALKQLMLSKKIEQRKTSLLELVTQEAGLKTREAELEASIDEAKTDEETAAVEEAADKLETEKKELDEKKSKLENEIAELEGELEQLNSKEPKNDSEKRNHTNYVYERKEDKTMKRNKFFYGMTREQVESLITRSEVKEFLARTREMINQKRSVTGGELGIPEVFLDILRDNLNQYSKLISKISLRPVAGHARQNIVGAVPEGIWTEAVGKLNELAIVFNQLEVDGYKVGGFVAVPNSTLEDSDIALANEIMTAIGQAIGLAIDKAILYGTGAKMPVGIVTRLAESAKPAYWGDNEKAWTDIHATHLLLIDAAANTDVLFYKDLIMKLGVAEANYSDGSQFWAMSTKTFRTLQAKALTINAAGAIVSGQNNTMPIIGGDVVILDFVPNNVVVGGYGSLYLLAERAGATLAQSEHVQFIEDNTVFKGTARYDGRPVFGEAFVAINISQEVGAVAPTANAVTFAADTANAA
jgi:HK97 family phage major capsid protein